MQSELEVWKRIGAGTASHPLHTVYRTRTVHNFTALEFAAPRGFFHDASRRKKDGLSVSGYMEGEMVNTVVAAEYETLHSLLHTSLALP